MLKIYNASAGSGKTNQLVNEYLKLVLKNPSSYKNIIAITFTNNAAAEMKSRIIDALSKLINDDFTSMDEELELLINEINYKENAQNALDNILHDYSNFSISTIDSFFQKIIRSFAKELNLPLGFDVELDSDNVLNESIELLFGNSKSNPILQENLEKYVYELIGNDKGWNIDRELFKIGQELFKENYLRISEERSNKDSGEFIKKLDDMIADFDGRMMNYSLEAEKLIHKYGLSSYDFAHGEKGVGNFLINCIREKNYKMNSYVMNALKDNRWYSAKSTLKNEIDNCVVAGLGKILSDVIELIEDQYTSYLTCTVIRRNIHLTGFLNHLAAMIGEYRKQKKIFLISDTNFFLNKIIGNEDTPFIYEKTGIRYNHYLIDEFQDTSSMQWENLLPLVSNSLSEGNTALLVGDVKQSIYRWRGGEMKLLLGDVTEKLNQFEISQKPLKINHRSRENIIEFNNKFFEKLIENFKTFDYYDTVIEKVFKDFKQWPKEKKGGYVRFKFIENDSIKEGNTEIAKEECYKIIKEVEAKGYSKKDIMILVTKNKESYDIAEYLNSKGINVISQQSLQIKNSFAVQFIISLFKLIDNNEDRIAESQMRYFYESELLKNINGFHDVFSVAGLNFLTQEKLKKLAGLSLYEIAEESFRIFGLNKLNDIYLQRFLDMMIEYSKVNGNDIREFLDWWELHKDDITVMISPDEDAITLMTIHKAKGLQKPVVILPFANWLLQKQGERRLWVFTEEEQFKDHSPFYINLIKDLDSTTFGKDYRNETVANYIDNLNLLYVAFTRAEDMLFIISPRTGSKNKNIYNILKSVISDFGEQLEEVEKDLVYSFGEFENKFIDNKNNADRNEISSAEYILEPEQVESRDKIISWQERFITRSKGHSLIGISDENVIEKINTGNILHEALARLDKIEYIDPVLEKMILDGVMIPSQKDFIKNEIESILKIPEMKNWFNDEYKIYTEREIITAAGKILRPDRVMIKNNSDVIVADYKTGGKKDEHSVQVKEYKRELENAGYKNVKGFLVYIESKEIVEVEG